MKSALMLLIVCALVAGAGLADEVVLTDGRVLEGRVVSQGGDVVVIKTMVGLNELTTTIDAQQVKSISKGVSREDKVLVEYRRRRARIRPQSASDWYGLGMWMRSQPGFGAKANMAFSRALELDPAHAGSLKALGRGVAAKGAAAGSSDAAKKADMLVGLMDALGLLDEEVGSLLQETPNGPHPFEELNYRFYREGVARNEYLGLRYRDFGLVGQQRGAIDLVNGSIFDSSSYYDEVVDPLTGLTSLVPREFAPGDPSLPAIGAVWFQDIPAYNAAAQRLGFGAPQLGGGAIMFGSRWGTIPAVGVTPRIPLQH